MEAVVRVHHGSLPIYVRDLGKCLMVLGVFDIPLAIRQNLAEATPEVRAQFLVELEGILMSCPRVGYGLAPPGATDPISLERVVLDQTLQIAEDDPSSFNRFCDAIQETETILLRAASFIQRFSPVVGGPLRYSSSTPPPTEPYL